MPIAISSVCVQCGRSFILKPDEFIIPAGLKIKGLHKKKTINQVNTWADWLIFGQYFCENCRPKTPPQRCTDDYNKLQDKMVKMHDKSEEDRESEQLTIDSQTPPLEYI